MSATHIAAKYFAKEFENNLCENSSFKAVK